MKLVFPLLIVAIFFGNPPLYGRLHGKAKLDSLLNELPKLNDGDKKVNLLYSISNMYGSSDTSLGLKYGREAMLIALKLGSEDGIAMANNAIGENYHLAGDYKNAFLHYELAKKGYRASNDKMNASRCDGNMANMYDEQGNYQKALEYDFEALKIAEELGNKEAITINLGNIAIIYKELAKYRQSIEYNLKAMKLCEELKDTEQVATLLGNIGNVYHNWDTAGNEDKALAYELRALGIYQQLGNKSGVIRNLTNISSVYISLKKFDSSLKYSKEALKVGKEANNTHDIALNLGGIGEVYYLLGCDSIFDKGNSIGVPDRATALKTAFDYYSKAKDIFLETGDLEKVIVCYETLYKIAELQGNDKIAFNYLKQYTVAKDSLAALNNQDKIAAIETERALLVKDKQIEADERKSVERKFFFSVTGLLLLIISIVVLNFIRQRKLTVQKTKLANEKEDLLQQKEILIKEIHHRVKNNLQVVVSLLDLQTGNTKDEVARNTMTESAARVKSISLIHRFLYQNEGITGIEYAHFIRELFTQVVAVFKRQGQVISLDEQVPETILDIDTAVPLGLILNELLINSFKYAFPGDDGKVTISLVQNDDNYELKYADSGKGLGADFNIKAATTMGMTIMRNLSKQVGGTISYNHEQNSFTIVFKDMLGRKKVK